MKGDADDRLRREIVASYSDIKTEHGRALAEERLWQTAGASVRRAMRRRDWLRSLLGDHLPRNVISNRARLLAAPDFLWDRVEAGMPLGTAARLHTEARRLARKDDRDVLAVLRDVLAHYDALPASRDSRGRVLHKRRISVASAVERAPRRARPKVVWQRIRDDLGQLIAGRAGSVDEFTRTRVLADLEGDLRILINQYNNRLGRLRRESRVPVTRREVLADCRALHMDPPGPGGPVDMKLAKSQMRRLSRAYHPDARGSEETRDLYQQVVEAYDRLERYAEETKPSPRKPKPSPRRTHADPGNHRAA